jgi:leader peptidase (prepilin peptidase)/N-methyltransferase
MLGGLPLGSGWSAAGLVLGIVAGSFFGALFLQKRRGGLPLDRRRRHAAEAAAVVVGVAAFLAHELPAAAFTAILGWWLFLLAALDAETGRLPPRLTVPLIAAALPVAWLGIGAGIEDRLIGAAAGFAVGIGLGWLNSRELPEEAWLAAAVGAWLGWQWLPVAAVGAGLLALVVLMAGRAPGRVPVGGLLAVAAWPVWIFSAA